MATLATTAATLLDWSKIQDPDGKIAAIVEILNETNEILEDMLWVEGNLPTGHRTTVRSGLPAVAWRLLNYGVQPSKSRSVQVTDSVGMLEAYSKVDKDLAMLNGNTSAFRLSEDRAFLESMNQTLADTLFYGNASTDPEKFTGLASRYSSLAAENGDNIIDGGGTGADNCSIWLIGWGDQSCHGIFPKGSQAGLQHRDLGEDTATDANGGEYQILRTHYQWKAGITLKDWRYAVRIANIDTSDLTKDAATGADLIDLMTQAIEIMPSTMVGRPVFYCNRTVKSYLRRQIANKDNVNLTLDNAGGKHILNFDGIPVRRVDALTNAEAQVT